MTNAFFTEQLEDEKEAWKVEHDAAMECMDLETLLGRGICLYHMIRQSDEAWSRKVQHGTEKFSAQIAKDINAAYKWWLQPCDFVMGLIKKYENDYDIEDAEEFRRCYRMAKKIATISADDVVEAFAQVERNEVAELTAEDWGGLQGSTNG